MTVRAEEARYRTVRVILSLEPDILDGDDRMYLDQVLAGGPEGLGVSEVCARWVSVIPLDHCFSRIRSKATTLEAKMELEADLADPGPAPMANPSTMLFQYFDWLSDGVGDELPSFFPCGSQCLW